MNIVVLGAGAIGGYFGGRLAQGGACVTFLVREPRYRQLQQRGLRIKSPHGDAILRPTLSHSADDIREPDLVILAVKNYHLASTLPTLQTLVNRGAKVLPLLNGVQHMETLTRALGAGRILGGACYIEATLNADGDVVQTGPMQDVTFGAVEPIDSAFLDDVADWFQRASIPVTLSPHIMVELWQKYVFLATISGITAAARLPVGAILDDPITVSFLRELINEIVEIAHQQQTGLPANLDNIVLSRVQALPRAMTSSLHRDLEKGLPLELDSLQGALIAMGREYGMNTPHLEAIYALLHPFAAGPAPRNT